MWSSMDIDRTIDRLLQGDSDDLILIGGDHQSEMGEISKSIAELIVRGQNDAESTVAGACRTMDNFFSNVQCEGPASMRFLQQHKIRKITNDYRLIIDAINQTETALKLQEAQLLKDNAILKGFHERLGPLLQSLEDDISTTIIIKDGADKKVAAGLVCASADSQDAMDRLARRTESLMVSQITSQQMRLQIELLRANNRKIIDLIVETITNTIPLWRNRISLIAGLNVDHSAAVPAKQKLELAGVLAEINEASQPLQVAFSSINEEELKRETVTHEIALTLRG